MIVHGIANVVLWVGDLGRAKAFYGGILGLPEKLTTEQVVVYVVGDPAGPGLVVRQHTGVEGGAYPRQTPRVWLSVPDARAQAEAFRADGVGIVTEPMALGDGSVVFEIADDWGNVVGFVS